MNGMTNGREKPTTIAGVGGAITLGTGLTMTGSELSASGGGGEQHLYWHTITFMHTGASPLLNCTIVILSTTATPYTATTMIAEMNTTHGKYVIMNGGDFSQSQGSRVGAYLTMHPSYTTLLLFAYYNSSGTILEKDYDTNTSSFTVSDTVTQIF